MIEVQGLTFRYSDGTTALADISVSVPRERIFGILGQSGSGKTTLLNCLARFLKPAEGAILLDGCDIHAMPMAEFRRRLGVVFQKLNLFPHLTILGNMTLAPRCLRKAPADEAESQAREMLERLGIPELAEAYPAQISGGQAQRAAIARSLMLQPEYMLLDEPTSALDAHTTDDFADWLLELRESTSFVIVTHDVPFARKVATHGATLRAGRIEQVGRMEEILEQLQGDK